MHRPWPDGEESSVVPEGVSPASHFDKLDKTNQLGQRLSTIVQNETALATAQKDQGRPGESYANNNGNGASEIDSRILALSSRVLQAECAAECAAERAAECAAKCAAGCEAKCAAECAAGCVAECAAGCAADFAAECAAQRAAVRSRACGKACGRVCGQAPVLIWRYLKYFSAYGAGGNVNAGLGKGR